MKIGDFGISKVLDSTKDFAKTCIGTPYYMSPELLKYKPYSYKSDIWALGCILYEMCNLRYAFDANSFNGLAMKILKGTTAPTATSYSKGLRDVIAKMMCLDPKNRPTIKDVLEFKIIKEKVVAYAVERFRSAPTTLDANGGVLDSLKEQVELLGLYSRVCDALGIGPYNKLSLNGEGDLAKKDAESKINQEKAMKIKREISDTKDLKKKIADEMQKLKEKQAELRKKNALKPNRANKEGANGGGGVPAISARPPSHKAKSYRIKEQASSIPPIQQKGVNSSYHHSSSGGGGAYGLLDDVKASNKRPAELAPLAKGPISSFGEANPRSTGSSQSTSTSGQAGESQRDKVLRERGIRKKQLEDQHMKQFESILYSNKEERLKCSERYKSEYRPSTGLTAVLGSETKNRLEEEYAFDQEDILDPVLEENEEEDEEVKQVAQQINEKKREWNATNKLLGTLHAELSQTCNGIDPVTIQKSGIDDIYNDDFIQEDEREEEEYDDDFEEDKENNENGFSKKGENDGNYGALVLENDMPYQVKVRERIQNLKQYQFPNSK